MKSIYLKNKICVHVLKFSKEKLLEIVYKAFTTVRIIGKPMLDDD